MSKPLQVRSIRLAGGASALITAFASVIGYAEPMSPRTTLAPPVSPATLGGESDRQMEALVRKMMLSPPSAMPAALLDVDQIVRGDQPLLNIVQLKSVSYSPPMNAKQAAITKKESRVR